jgi:hypothetical protein
MLALMAEHIGVGRMDRVWIFPPLVRGRREWGLVAVSCTTEDPEQRELLTGRYSAELTGQGVTFQPELASEGKAPPDRLPRIMDGVVRRSDLQLEIPREAEVGGDEERFAALLGEYETEETSEEE